MSKRRRLGGNLNKNFRRQDKGPRPPRDISSLGRVGSFRRKYDAGAGSSYFDEYEPLELGGVPSTFGSSLNSQSGYISSNPWDDYPSEERSFETVPESNSRKFEEELNILEDFICEYTGEQKSFLKQKDLVAEMIIPIAKVLWNYYDPKYDAIRNEMNNVLKIMSTEIFASTLRSVLKERLGDERDEEGYFMNWDVDYQYLGYAISLLLGTCKMRMCEETEEIYVTEIGPGIWTNEIDDIMGRIRVTKELAADLMMKTPIMYDKMENYHIGIFYQGFLDSMIIHADDNAEMLTTESQLLLFNYLYGRGKTAAKVIGRYLTDPPRESFRTKAEEMIYEAFKKMLYEKLNSFDIDLIRFVVKFISTQKLKNADAGQEETPMIFDFDVAADYPNLNRAMSAFLAENKNAKLA